MLRAAKSGRKVYVPTEAEDAAIAAGVAQDPDTFEPTDAEFAAMRRVAPTKERITIRLSPDVVARFRATGPGWQTRMDAALKDWLRDHSPERLG
ncbi:MULTISPECIES: BrnA antitoxin family protein [Ectothiorhodospira]|uniref:BrnA antitoxin family protein n=1 Tax=Ectothiorhodospira TaxID=1051 RepID=UPI001902F9CD|nr:MULTISPECIES: BrnA antitoxin family protein [Ectothiorhodospira]MBK1674178.1 hypothetical protein [Ectothiorhodospira shaposhnikovii]MCG5500494.1 BrnA antitoxin family protein [Ectothiorhodospira lacustris]